MRTKTHVKSTQHQASVKYFLKPYANHLSSISVVKITLNVLSAYSRMSFRRGFFGKFTSSSACTSRCGMTLETE